MPSILAHTFIHELSFYDNRPVSSAEAGLRAVSLIAVKAVISMRVINKRKWVVTHKPISNIVFNWLRHNWLT